MNYQGIEGLVYTPNFLTVIGQVDVLGEIARHEWSNELQRRVQHHGYRYSYRDRKVSKEMYLGPLPPWAAAIGQELFNIQVPWPGQFEGTTNIFPKPPNQVIVNEYLAGQGIAAHVDCVPCFGPTIATISLGAVYPINFTNRYTGRHEIIPLEAGSALILTGEARYRWTHSIDRVREDNGVLRKRRVSITFRTVIL